MPRTLSDRAVLTVSYQIGQKGWREITDGGCRGLCLRVSPRGEKVWAVRHMIGGRRQRHTIGAYPEITLTEARRRASQYLAAARDGVDHVTLDARLRALKMTISDAHAEYLVDREMDLRARTYASKKRLFELHIKPKIGHRLIKTIRRADVRNVVREVKQDLPVQANRVFSEIMALLRWCEDNDYLEGVPTIQKSSLGERELPRERALLDIEIRDLWMASAELGAKTRDFLRLLLLTGQRRDEVRLMQWCEIDIDRALWTIPKERYKTKINQFVPLSEPVLGIIRTHWRPSSVGFVLRGRADGDAPFNGAASAMRRLRKLMPNAPHFTLHDLRRTVRTGLSKLGIDRDTAELVIGHLPPEIVRTYDKDPRISARRAALEQWAAHVSKTAAGVSSEISKAA